MTVETKTDLSPVATAEWTEARQQGERGDGPSKSEPPPEANQEEPVFASASPPVSWPRVFPGL
ncbi:MAG TPA: hypothetical protein VFQ90_11260 [Stellaceae bacterium]|nr:hypothetical protein [Stellaceae bacterium]